MIKRAVRNYGPSALILIVVTVALLPVSPENVLSALYQWVDEAGITHFSDTPPADKEYTAPTGARHAKQKPEGQKEKIDNRYEWRQEGKMPPGSSSRILPVRGFTSKGMKRIDEEMIGILRDTGYKAATIAITYNGKFVLIRGYGWQDRDLTIPINPYTRMRIASIDKCFGAAAAKTLIREGKLSPDVQVFRYLSVLPYNGKIADKDVYAITLNDLMEHKLGWDKKHDGFSGRVKSQVKKQFNTEEPTMEQFNRYMVAQPLQNRPGTKKVYSNYGSVVLRRVVEKAAGLPYLEYLKSLSGNVNVRIHESLPVQERAYDEIWYAPETQPYFDCFSISAPDLCVFFQHYWVSGEPRKRNGYVYSFHGSLPGTTSVIRQRTDGINYAILFNERGKIGNGDVDKRINSIIDQITDWSTDLSKDDYEFQLDIL